ESSLHAPRGGPRRAHAGAAAGRTGGCGLHPRAMPHLRGVERAAASASHLRQHLLRGHAGADRPARDLQPGARPHRRRPPGIRPADPGEHPGARLPGAGRQADPQFPPALRPRGRARRPPARVERGGGREPRQRPGAPAWRLGTGRPAVRRAARVPGRLPGARNRRRGHAARRPARAHGALHPRPLARRHELELALVPERALPGDGVRRQPDSHLRRGIPLHGQPDVPGRSPGLRAGLRRPGASALRRAHHPPPPGQPPLGARRPARPRRPQRVQALRRDRPRAARPPRRGRESPV
ncbi:MAG: Subclass B3 beta-lactamase, partial [uncultured Gemmatimonadetes bacterium]